MNIIKGAGVQISPVLYSREGTVDKVLQKIIELGRQGVQFATFPAPLMAFKGMLPNVVHSVPLLAVRLGAIAGGAIAGVWLAGIAVQLPWLLLPGFFLALTLIMYLVPIRQNPIAGYCVALTLVVVTYSGVCSPLAICSNALTLAVGFCVGTISAALFSFLPAIPPPR